MENERIRLQIMALSKKIDAEPERNLISNIIKDARGSNLMLRILEIEISNPVPMNDGLGSSDQIGQSDVSSFQSLMYTIQGFSKENLSEDSPLPLIREEDESEDVNKIPQLGPKLILNKEQYYSSQESHIIGSYRNNHLFDHTTNKDRSSHGPFPKPGRKPVFRVNKFND